MDSETIQKVREKRMILNELEKKLLPEFNLIINPEKSDNPDSGIITAFMSVHRK